MRVKVVFRKLPPMFSQGLDSRLRGNDGCATAGIQGWRGWVPVSTGTTGGTAPRLGRKSTSLTRVYRIGVYENWKA